MAPELALVRTPFATYRGLALAERSRRGGTALQWRRPLLVCLVLGLSIALGTTGRASLGLVLGSALCWSFVPAAQMGAFAAVTRVAALPRGLSFARAADLFFIGHLPWSLWLLVVAGATALAFPEGAAAVPPAVRTAVASSAILPAAGTAVLTFAFWREAIGLRRARALLAALAYHGLVWGFGFVYAALAAQLWPRLLAR